MENIMKRPVLLLSSNLT